MTCRKSPKILEPVPISLKFPFPSFKKNKHKKPKNCIITYNSSPVPPSNKKMSSTFELVRNRSKVSTSVVLLLGDDDNDDEEENVDIEATLIDSIQSKNNVTKLVLLHDDVGNIHFFFLQLSLTTTAATLLKPT